MSSTGTTFAMIRIYYALCTALVLLTGQVAFGQKQVVITPGNITKTTVRDHKVTIQTQNAIGEISVYRADIIRIRMGREILEKDHSYAVVANPDKTVKTDIIQNATSIIITTDSLKAVINKNPFSIAIYNSAGQLLNEDEKGLTTSWTGDHMATYKKLQKGERFIGLGEKTGNLDRKGNGYSNWNTDAYGYNTGQDPLYSSIPFYMGIHDGLCYGIFFDNSYRSDFNFGASNDRFSSFGADGGEMNYYFMGNTTIAGLIESYTYLTGRMPLPPMWSLGYQQNRYSYYPETEVMRIAATLREKKIPADGITLDIHYMDAYKLFTWDRSRFPNPKSMTDKLASMGFKMTVIVDPGIKREPGYGAYERGLKEGIFIKYSDGSNYTGQVWPGWCHFPDFTSEKGRNWWKNEVKTYANDGVSGLWNDMNEIATWGQKMSDNILFDFDGNPTTHRQAHNVYGLLMTKSSYEGYRQALNGKRPFILTRAGYAGLQRYTAIWTGDNRSEDDHMLAGVRLVNSLGLSGVPFSGMDVGGFIGNPSTNLFIRWVQLGAFTPYFRNHTALNTSSSEPWTHGEEALDISRNYINLRYKLMPYLYTCFYEATQTGIPVSRSLAIDYTSDPKIYDPAFQNQFLFGPSLMVVPVTGAAGFVKIYFPKGKWYNLYTGETENGNTEKIIQTEMSKLPVYVRSGSIITAQSLVQSTSEQPTDTLTVYVYHGTEPNSFTYYEDAGDGYQYETGAYYKRKLSLDPVSRSIIFSKPEGSYASKFKTLKVVLTGFDNSTTLKLNGSPVPTKEELISHLTSLSLFDPQGNLNPAEGYNAKSIIISNENEIMNIGY